jgi:hypothetical protein
MTNSPLHKCSRTQLYTSVPRLLEGISLFLSLWNLDIASTRGSLFYTLLSTLKEMIMPQYFFILCFGRRLSISAGAFLLFFDISTYLSNKYIASSNYRLNRR